VIALELQAKLLLLLLPKLVRSFGTPPATAARRASKITLFMAAISDVGCGLSGPFQPNISLEKEARWSKGSTYRGLS
jgi:hypothetical protein